MRPTTPFRLLLLLALLVAGACADQIVSSDLRPKAASMDIVSGQDQVGAPATQLGKPLVVRVLDANGNTVSNQIVNFRVTSGGGSVYGGTALTNASGIAQEWWTLGSTIGLNTLEARAVDSSTGERLVFATFSAEARAPVASVTVTPGSDSVVVGSTRTLTATVRDASGSVLTGRTVTWASSDSSIATVRSTGASTAEVKGVVAGNVTITASSEGKIGAATIGILPPPTIAPWMEVNFEGYGSTTALRGDCVVWNCVEDIVGTGGQLSLDTSAGYTAAGLTKSMRYDYVHSGNGCNSITVSRSFPLKEPLAEVWAEFVVRWSESFTTTNNLCAPNDHKLIFGGTEQPGTYRWGLYWGADTGPDHSVQVEHPGYTTNRVVRTTQKAAPYWDGKWHVVRVHFRNSTNNSTADGQLRLWVDGVLVHEMKNFVTDTQSGARNRIPAFALGRNKDDGPANVPMSIWWGRARVWNGDPGWK